MADYDFWALTDHAENTSGGQWWRLKKLADLFHAPGEHVPLYGFEWTADTGHMNVIYGDVDRDAPIFSALAEGSDTPDKLWDHLDDHPEHPAVTIPHHTASEMTPFHWDYRSEDYLRLVEVFQSCRGSYEHDGCFRQYSDAVADGRFVTDALADGHRFGLIASSDHGTGSAYVGAYATGLSRGEVFDALHDRRTIGATTRDVDLALWVGDAFLGGETTADGPTEATVRCRAYTQVARVDLLVDGQVARTLVPDLTDGGDERQVALQVGWRSATQHESLDFSGGLSVDGGRIARTPFHSPLITGRGDDWVSWSARTRGFGDYYGRQRGGLDLTVLGPDDAALRVEAGGLALDTDLAAVAGGGVETTGRSGRLRARPGVGGLVGLGSRSVEPAWTVDLDGADFVYARAVLRDGEMAWTSPVWIR